MKIGLNFSFELGSIDGFFAINVFEKLINFEPGYLSFRDDQEPWGQDSKIIMAEASSEDRIYVSSKDYSQFFSFTQTGTKKPHNSIELVQSLNLVHGLNLGIEKIISHDGFVSAFLHDADYTEVQSTVYLNNLSASNLSLNSIKDTPYHINEFGNKQYDISKNPGRELLIGGTWLISAWKMWFGSPFFNIVSKEKVMKFPDAIEIAELTNGIVYIQLFENIDESDSKNAMEIQRRWIEWLGYEELETKYP